MIIERFVLTIFTGSLSFECVSRIFDIYIIENEKIFFRAMLAIFKLQEKQIFMESDEAQVLRLLQYPTENKEFSKITGDKFIECCLGFNFSYKLIKSLDHQYQQREEE